MLWLWEGMVAADNKAKLLQDAERFVLQGKIQQAIGEYRKIVRCDPNNAIILNTIGDLCLWQGNRHEAQDCFSQVAEIYVRDSFLSRAIAVYKKILSTDSGNPGINLIVASLCAKRGLRVDARNQYLRAADLFEKQGKVKESLNAYEKVVELDPANAAIRHKLAELYLAEGATEKARFHLTGAARAQAKAGDLAGAMDSCGRAMQLNPPDAEAAEQCLFLADLHRQSNDGESARSYLAKAKKLCPDAAIYGQDLEGFAHWNEIALQGPISGAKGASRLRPGTDGNLPGKRPEASFALDRENAAQNDPEQQANPDAIIALYPQQIPSPTPPQSIEEQLHEVDFYIRLGFHDEALARLNGIAKINPEYPELAERYQKLGETQPPVVQEAEKFSSPETPGPEIPADAIPPKEVEVLREPRINNAPDNYSKGSLDTARAQPVPEPDSSASQLSIRKHPATMTEQAPVSELEMPTSAIYDAEITPARYSELLQPQDHYSPAPAQPDYQINDMFADLIDEVSSSTDQNVEKEDFEEHFSLGTAYREMELIEEAIEEFQNAIKTLDVRKDARRVIQCCGMLSTCFLTKGMPRSAVRWCQTGLSVADISFHESMALRYDMGVAHSMAGSNEQALECFDRIFGLDPGYRDVAQRIDDLRADQ